MVLTDLTSEDTDRLANQWSVADELVQKTCRGARLQRSEADLPLLQHVIDSQVIAPSQTYELQCLGVALGYVLVSNVAGLAWAVVDDEYGRDPTIRYRQTTLQFNVLTLISKRVEQSEAVDVSALYRWLCDKVGALGDTVD